MHASAKLNIGTFFLSSTECQNPYVVLHCKTTYYTAVVKISDGDGEIKKEDIYNAPTELGLCLVAFKISKLYKILYHIESLNACIKY